MAMCPARSLNNGAPVISTDNILGILQWCSISISNCIIELPHTEHHTRIHERKALREVYCNEWENSYWNPLAPFGRYQFSLVYIMVCVCLYFTVQIQSNICEILSYYQWSSNCSVSCWTFGPAGSIFSRTELTVAGPKTHSFLFEWILW